LLRPGLHRQPPCSPNLRTPQVFESTVAFQIGTRTTSHVLALVVKNATLVARPPGVERRRTELFTQARGRPAV